MLALQGVLDNFIIVRLALEDSRATFGRLGALGLPYFSCIPANMEVVPGKNIALPSRLSMAPAPVEDWNPEQVAKFISAATGLDMGEASQFGGRSPFLPLFALFFLGSVGVVGYKLANSRLYVIHACPLLASSCPRLLASLLALVSVRNVRLQDPLHAVVHLRQSNGVLVFGERWYV